MRILFALSFIFSISFISFSQEDVKFDGVWFTSKRLVRHDMEIIITRDTVFIQKDPSCFEEWNFKKENQFVMTYGCLSDEKNPIAHMFGIYTRGMWTRQNGTIIFEFMENGVGKKFHYHVQKISKDKIRLYRK